MARRIEVDTRTEPGPGVTVQFFAGVCKLLTEKYGDRMIDVECLRQHLEKVEHAYIRSEPWKPQEKSKE